MKKRIAISALMLCLIFLAFEHYAAEQTQEAAKECCFARKGYQGTCKVTPAEDETCSSILKYLNTPRTVGKTYCGASKLRGGWVMVDCKDPETEE